MTDELAEAKRIQALRRELIAAIPRFPNDRASQQAVGQKALTGLLITYIGWRLRSVGVRARKVEGRAILAGDPRAAALKPNLDAFLEAVEAGGDLTPYLSLKARNSGYTPEADPAATPSPNTWADKDFLLNVMGLHHFHLGLAREAAGHAVRTDDVLFASVTRDKFEILGLFRHEAFEHAADGTMTPERDRLWAVYTAREEARALPGQLQLGGFGGLGVTLGSNPVSVTLTAQHLVRIMREIEPKLDDRAYVRELLGLPQDAHTPKLKWFFNHLDFGLLDAKSSTFHQVYKGPN